MSWEELKSVSSIAISGKAGWEESLFSGRVVSSASHEFISISLNFLHPSLPFSYPTLAIVMKVQAALAGLAAVAAAFPAIGEFNSEFRDQIKRNAEAAPDEYEDLERRGLLSNLGDDINGLLGSVTKGTLDLNNKRPEPGYEFRAPGPGDSRGPCPGLNLLANYG